ncbi:MAG: hypothetical protein HRU15_12275 [Planctomycetes bacterium]|nr:hypothetical protein [Planctomycetota bacterium]
MAEFDLQQKISEVFGEAHDLCIEESGKCFEVRWANCRGILIHKNSDDDKVVMLHEALSDGAEELSMPWAELWPWCLRFID